MSKIKDIDIMEVGDIEEGEKSSPWSSTIVVLRMTTSDGIVGYGEAPTTLMTKPVIEEAREMARVLKGKDPTEIEKNSLEVYKHSFYMPESMETTSAFSAIEIASWDIIGKTYGVPVYKMLGGRLNEKIKAYANGWYSDCVSADSFAKKAKEVSKAGFKAMKFDPFGDAYDEIDKEHLEHAVDVIGAVKDAAKGSDVLIECHGRFNANSAIRMARAIEGLEPAFVEEPVHSDNIMGLKRLRTTTNVPIALGERVMNKNLFLPYLTDDLVDIVQPDITNCRGILEGKKIASMAESFGVEVAFHNAFGPIQTAASLNVDITIPNFFMQESFEHFWPEWKKKLVKGGYKLEDGMFTISGKPGLGIDVNERILEEYKVDGMEPFNPNEPSWAVKGTWKPPK
ncbi:mandelate racemase subfamily of enolase superfamily enzyme [Candidatus Mancarchaeum acidiphilum]|uniref:Mandelate racemase subfamily of enolase superfamily enzyme n=1 Tax=Candidatus Mancarchaeum acidiphilum TaxID=1920749 RepID=A0A218NMD4_9ARCH|nr:mandelate racemase/muconate lactonizing enzyme family protein [Candidatus Mancarchaeum acidiphilum]ASI13628.1 mandelate racemase subfamily of enolase superfamily enzyme [Candidatus Mancarchaeum acidiphilum]